MLVLPFYSICAISLISILLPWIKELQEPSIALLSAVSRDCFKGFGDWLQVSTGDAGRRPPPLSSPPLIVYLPTCSILTPPWNGTKDYILLPTGSLLATVTQAENSLSLVTPFKVYPPRFPPPSPRVFETGSAVNDAGEIFPEGPIISNDGLPLFLGLVASVLVSFHLVVYISWKMEMAKMRNSAEEQPTAKQMEDLSKAKIVLDKKDSYLKGVLDGLETTSKLPETSSSCEAKINILEHLYVEDSEPTLFSVKRWTMPKSEFKSTYGVDPSTVVSQFPVRGSPKSNSDQDGKGPAFANDAQPALRQSANGGRPTTIQATDRISTVVSDFHVERPSEPNRSSVPESVERPQRPPGPIETPAMVDIHAGGPSDMTVSRRRQHVPSASTTVDIRVEGASDRFLVEQRTNPPADNSVERPPEPVMPSSVTDPVEPSAMVDIHVEGAPDAKVTGAGVQSDTSTVASRAESGQDDDGYDSSTSVQTAILALTTPSAAVAAATATLGVDVDASPQTESPQTEQPNRRRRNRMGQRQRRRLREIRENCGWESPQLQEQEE
jgi:hypothetical protein